MRLWEVFRFEVVCSLRRASTWVYLVVLLALTFGVTISVLVEEARRAGDVHADSPIAVAGGMILMSMMGMLITAALVGNAAARDIELGTYPLFFTSPVGKADYLGGRFLGSFLVNAILLAVIPLGLLLATRTLNLEPDLLGPYRPWAYVQPYLLLLLPNLFITGSVLFAFAALGRRTLAGYAGVLILFFGSVLSEEVLAEQMAWTTLGSLLDPFGFTVISEQWASWTALEKNAQLIGLKGPLLWNRTLWLILGTSILVFTFHRVRFTHSMVVDRLRRGERPSEAALATERRTAIRVPRVSRPFGFGARSLQGIYIARQSLLEILISRGFLAVVVGTVAFVPVVGRALVNDTFGAPTWPLTQLVTWFLCSILIGIGVSFLTAFYAGELVWRERDARIDDIADTTPVSTFVLFAGKFLALSLVIAFLQAVLLVSGMLLQSLQGYFHFEIFLYLRLLFGLQLAEYILFAAAAMLIHVLVNHKYLGHLIVLLFYGFTVSAQHLRFAHNLLIYSANPGWVYSDLSGLGPFLAPYLWFSLYWAGWALLLAVATNLLWVRGRERGVQWRIRLARRRFTRAAVTVTATAAGIVLTAGGFIFYNTNILNDYRTDAEEKALRADYERRYSQYRDALQPEVRAVKLHVEIYPEERKANVRGTYSLENRTTAGAIDSIHLAVHEDVETRAATFDRAARETHRDDSHGHRIYSLEQPLLPGESMRLDFQVLYRPQGFPNHDINTSVVGNGTFFDQRCGGAPNKRRWLPAIGYQPSRELTDALERRTHGLGPRPAGVRPFDDGGPRPDAKDCAWIDFEAVIGTAQNQTAVAPGELRETWTENGRRYFRYVTDGPVKNTYAIFSADYRLHNDRWNDVDIQILYHPSHTFNLDRMVRSTKASLRYYTQHFGPYPHRHIRVVEFPRYENFAHAYPGTIAYSEGFAFLTRVEGEQIDRPSLATAYEVARQWWGYQLNPAAVEGSALLTEVLSQYSALIVMEEMYGPQRVRDYRRVLLQDYLNQQTNHDVPLLRVSDPSSVICRKGALAMYALREYVGEDRVNEALRHFLETHRSRLPPYPTSLDLYEDLQAVTPKAFRHLPRDLFAKSVVWDLRLIDARSEALGSDSYRVTLRVTARKLESDGAGNEIEVPVDDWVEIGVFTSTEKGVDAPLHLEKHRLRSGKQAITVTVHQKPAWAGIDPHHLLIDRRLEDNGVDVEETRASDR